MATEAAAPAFSKSEYAVNKTGRNAEGCTLMSAISESVKERRRNVQLVCATRSGLCHLEFACSAWLICCQRSFLHDLDLKNTSLNTLSKTGTMLENIDGNIGVDRLRFQNYPEKINESHFRTKPMTKKRRN